MTMTAPETSLSTQRMTVLMYHALTRDGPGSPGAADPHYAVSVAAFARHLRLARSMGMQLTSVAGRLADRSAAPGVALTFDDGHASNAEAADIVGSNGGRADFFVNSSTIGTRHSLSWTELRTMAAAGMSIQSHGHTHRYLDALPPSEARAELLRSKQMIEDGVGAAVTLFAPPGGRMRRDLLPLAAELGYLAVCSSSVGLWKHPIERLDRVDEIPRFAVLSSTSDRQLMAWVGQQPLAIAHARLRHQVLNAAKSMLGTHRYERLRAALHGAPAQSADR